MSNWDHLTQDVLIVVLQLCTLWCEHHSATFVPLQSASFLPSVLILSAVLTNAKRVALNMTVPSLFSGIFMETRRCGVRRRKRTIVLPTHGLKHALPYALMMPSTPATPLKWASMACGFSYTIIYPTIPPLTFKTRLCLPCSDSVKPCRTESECWVVLQLQGELQWELSGVDFVRAPSSATFIQQAWFSTKLEERASAPTTTTTTIYWGARTRLRQQTISRLEAERDRQSYTSVYRPQALYFAPRLI